MLAVVAVLGCRSTVPSPPRANIGALQQGLDGQMVSVSGQLELRYVPFSKLIDAKTMIAEMRMIERGSDFHRLAQELATRLPSR